MTEPMPSSACLDTRIGLETLTLAKRAAAIEGRSLSEFVATVAQAAARRTMEDAHIIHLSIDG